MECGGLPWSFPERTPILAVHVHTGTGQENLGYGFQLEVSTVLTRLSSIICSSIFFKKAQREQPLWCTYRPTST